MKRFSAIILMLCLSFQLVLKLYVITWFEVNKDYIAATLCENRDKPELVCCGKCVLTKKLANTEHKGSKDKQVPAPKIEKTNNVNFVLPGEGIGFSRQNFVVVASVIRNAIVPNHFDVAVAGRIFHPPSIAQSNA